jgi:D-tyrosyl-tRNA(Tyr) deacylase
MRVLLQRSLEASVTVDGVVVGAIDRGLVALVGTTFGDTAAISRRLGERTAAMRVFADADGRTNFSVADVGGAVLVVSQFTLYGNTKKGKRPSFVKSGPPDEARVLIEVFRQAIEDAGVPTASGVFAADMKVQLVNDGPFTILLEREPPTP